MPTTFVGSTLITADIPASALTAPGPDAVTVANPAPGDGASNSLNFAVPCVIAAPAPPSTQTRARLGAFFFDGWSGPLTNFHFQGLPLDPYQDRQPLSGWQDSSNCAIEQQLAWAQLWQDFFIVEWYFNTAVNEPSDNLNSGLQIIHALPDRHGMRFAMMYVNGPPFVVELADWASAINEGVSYMTDPASVRVNGKPMFVVLKVGQMRATFGSPAAVANALQQLRTAAQAQGPPRRLRGRRLRSTRRHTGTEFALQRFFHHAIRWLRRPRNWRLSLRLPPVDGMVPFSTLSAAGHWTWDEAASHSPLHPVTLIRNPPQGKRPRQESRPHTRN